MDAVSAVVGLKKAVNSFTEAVDEALSDIKSDIGLHMRSIESEMYEGGRHTLKEIARMGYTTIETDSYFWGKIYDLKPDEFRKAADEAGLKITSAHLRKYYEDDLPYPPPATEGADNCQSEEANVENGATGAESVTDKRDAIEAESATDKNRAAEAESATDEKGATEAEGTEVNAEAGATGTEQTSETAKEEKEEKEEEQDPVMKWWDEALDTHKALGCQYIVISRMPEAITPENVDRYAEYYVRIADKVTERGMKLCLHPSRRELAATDGVSLFDTMASLTPEGKVWFELDTREAHEAGVDMVATLKHYKGRVLLMHLHDYGIATESGLIDFDKIVTEAIATGVKDIFVEVRSYTLPPKNCIERSIYNLESLPSLRY